MRSCTEVQCHHITKVRATALAEGRQQNSLLSSRWLPGTMLGISYAKMSKARASGSAEQRLSTRSHVPDKTTGEPNIRTADIAEAYKTVAANSEVLNSLLIVFHKEENAPRGFCFSG